MIIEVEVAIQYTNTYRNIEEKWIRHISIVLENHFSFFKYFFESREFSKSTINKQIVSHKSIVKVEIAIQYPNKCRNAEGKWTRNVSIVLGNYFSPKHFFESREFFEIDKAINKQIVSYDRWSCNTTADLEN